jgi:glycerol-3-phosphate dehydrogenase
MDALIDRDVEGAAQRTWDVLVVGGGIYGVTLALEAAQRGLATLLVERGDFGGGTTWNSLRIVHGGLRYLQRLDVLRFRESVRERAWFLRNFPDLVAPLPCLMPLYDPPRGGALRRPAVFQRVLAMNDLLARRWSTGLRPGRVLNSEQTATLFPGVDREGLRGGALWCDAVMPDSQRVLIEILRWASRSGARALNYVEAVDLRVERGRAAGLSVVDHASGRGFELRGRVVVNCAGPWSRPLARRFDRDLPALFRPVLGFNLFLDREPPSRAALAVVSRERGAQTWFLLPWKGRLLAGTAYVPAAGESEEGPEEAQVEAFLDALNAAVPGFEARRSEVLRLHWGRLPGMAEGSALPAIRPVVHDHGRSGGPAGLVSVSGVKLTAARAVAEKVLALLPRHGLTLRRPAPVGRPAADPPLPLDDLLRLAERDPGAARAHVRGLSARQSVVHLEDLLFRRTDWGVLPGRMTEAVRLCESLGCLEGAA